MIHYSQLIIELATRFINVPIEEIDATIQDALQKIAVFVDIDRAYISRYYFKNKTTCITHEWCNQGIAPHKASLPDHALHIAAEMLKSHSKGEHVLY